MSEVLICLFYSFLKNETLLGVIIGGFLTFLTQAALTKRQYLHEGKAQNEELAKQLVSLNNDLRNKINNLINFTISNKNIDNFYFSYFKNQINTDLNYSLKLIKIYFSAFVSAHEEIINDFSNILSQLEVINKEQDKDKRAETFKNIYDINVKCITKLDTIENNIITKYVYKRKMHISGDAK